MKKCGVFIIAFILIVAGICGFFAARSHVWCNECGHYVSLTRTAEVGGHAVYIYDCGNCDTSLNTPNRY